MIEENNYSIFSGSKAIQKCSLTKGSSLKLVYIIVK